MPGRVFLDSNVLVYAQDARSPKKQRVSRDLITRLSRDADGVISTQVLQEFYVAATRKLGVPPLAAKGILKTFAVFDTIQVSPALIQDAIDCSILNQLSFWEALILAAASAAGSAVLLREDLNPGQLILGGKVENPLE